MKFISYYDKWCSVLTEEFLETVAKEGSTLIQPKISESTLLNLNSYQALTPSIDTNLWKPVGYFAVLRHADRQPKQKMKVQFDLNHYQRHGLM